MANSIQDKMGASKIAGQILQKSVQETLSPELVSDAPKKSFSDFINESLDEVNAEQKTSDQMTTDLATGKSENIHETMLAMSKAELSFNLMVQVRNKALEAYQEVMRMPV